MVDGNVICFGGIWSNTNVLDTFKMCPHDGAAQKVRGSPVMS